MFIIIDGYNLIRQSNTLRRHELRSLEAGRFALISKLSEYKKKKGHNITVVFDGWKGGGSEEERDRHESIDIIYSRYGEKADDVIKRIATQSTEETIVVSSDREIASHITRQGKTALSSLEFEVIMNRAIFSYLNRKIAPDSDDERAGRHKKKGPAKRLSRAKRNTQKKIKQL
jgi:uncharacterized protein